MTDRVFIDDKSFDTLVAISPEEAAKGLMHKAWPPPIMTFPFPKAGVRKFWMKNTISPLDIVFCREGQIIGVFAGEPFNLNHIGPDEPCDMVIEFPRGTVKKTNINIGDSVKISYSISTLSKKFQTK
jgi:uncharacterized membrane protein (UPF0127 family)